MTTVSDLLVTPVMQTLGLTLVHFLWQGTLVALVVAILLYALKDSSPSTRYLVSCTGLAVTLLFLITTFAYLAPNTKPIYQFTNTSRAALQANSLQTGSSASQKEGAISQTTRADKFTEVQATSQTVTSRFAFSSSSYRIYLPWFVALWLVFWCCQCGLLVACGWHVSFALGELNLWQKCSSLNSVS